MKKLLFTAALLALSGVVTCYQFDNRTAGPDYPVIIPPPKKLFSFGNETWEIAPCKISIKAEMPWSYDKDTQ